MRNNTEILIDYLDQHMTREDAAQIEKQISNDRAMAEELEYLKFSVNAIRRHSINEIVSQVRQSANSRTDIENQPAPAVVRSLYKTSLRIAAILVLAIGISALYKYISVNDQSVYEKQFINYSLNTTRGSEDRDPQTDAYQNKNWPEVIELFNKQSNKTNKSYFLAGISEMQLNHFPEAIKCFQNILQINGTAIDKTFEDEAEYYISLAYLMNHEENKAVNMLNKIRSDKNHTYYPIASQLSLVDLKVIELKR